MTTERETRDLADRYARRGDPGRYGPDRPDVRMLLAERRRAMLRLFGTGGNLLELVDMGFAPEHLAGVELLPDRFAHARTVLPAAIGLHCGDALDHAPADTSIDIAYVSTVFSSLLDEAYRERLATAMWRWLCPGGAVLWYDFTVDNPRNPDVRGVPLARLRQLFPQASVDAERVTLAPPLARALCRVHPALYTAFNSVPLLRTHLLAWLAKPR
jgi:Methyltransferase domain